VNDPEVPGPPARDRRVLDTRGAAGVLVGDFGIQVNVFEGTWTDPVVSPPLAAENGTVDSPYRGLSPFEQWDARFFFGRETAAAELVGRISSQLDRAGPLVVSGVSGAGKSSLLRAGVLPRIRDGRLAASGSSSWPCLVLTPTASPLDELANRVAPIARADADAIRRNLGTDPASFALTARQAATAGERARHDGARRLLLVVDQFEQLFTRCTDEAQQRAFITALHAAATGRGGQDPRPGALVVLVVRADFEPRCAEYAELEAAVQDRYLLTAMTERQLRLAISEPARRAGASVEDELVEVLLGEMLDRASAASADGSRRTVVSGAGVLPLLSHALDQAWRGRTGTALTLADYRRTGGIGGAVAASAQRAYDGLSPGQRDAARRVFTRLAATGSGGADTANRVARAELTAGQDAPDVEKVLEAFAGARLLTLAAGTVEVSHEVLLTAWPLLRGWLDDTRTDRRVRTRLADAAEEWTHNSRDRSYVYRGHLLDTATTTADRIRTDPRHPPLGRDEREFLRASSRARQFHTRTRRLVTAVLTVLAVATTTLAAVTVYRGYQLAGQLAMANAETLGRESQSRASTDIATAAQLALAAWRSDPKSPQARTALANAYLAMSALDAEIINPLDGPITAVWVNGDTAELSSGHGLAILTGITGPAPRRWEVPDLAPEMPFSVSLDGRWLAYLTKDGRLALRDVRARSDPRTLATGLGANGTLEFSPDGTRLAWYDGEPRVWDVATGEPRPNGVGTRLGTDVTAVWLTPDPNQILVRHGPYNPSNDAATRVTLNSLADGAESAAMPPGSLVARNGAEIVTCDQARPDAPDRQPTVTVMHVGTTVPPTRFPVDSASCARPVLSTDGGWLLTIGSSNSMDTVGLRDLRNGLEREVTVPSFPYDLPGRDTSHGVAPRVGVSNATGDPAVLFAHGTSVLRLRTEPALDEDNVLVRRLADGGRYVTVHSQETAQVTVTIDDVASGRRIATVPNLPYSLNPVLMGNSLWLFYAVCADRQFDRYEISPPHRVATFVPPAPDKNRLGWDNAFADERGSMLLTTCGGALSAVDPMTATPLAPPIMLAPPGPYEQDGTMRLAARPRHVGQAAVSTAGGVELWDVLNGRKLATIPVHPSEVGVGMVFDPSGQRIALLTQDKTIELWDVETATPVRAPIPAAGTRTLLGFDADGYLDTYGDRLTFIDTEQGREAGTMGASNGSPVEAAGPGEPVAQVGVDGEARPRELPLTAQAWHDKLCAAANRPFTDAELRLLPPGADRDPPC
jgi:WD40 repeat protein